MSVAAEAKIVDATASERDLATAGQLQRMLLPPSPSMSSGWMAVHQFEAAGLVSGDYAPSMPAGPNAR